MEEKENEFKLIKKHEEILSQNKAYEIELKEHENIIE